MPWNYNPSAHKVAELGYSIAKTMNAELIIAHVITEPEYYAMKYAGSMDYGFSYISNLVKNAEEAKIEVRNFLKAIVLN